MPRIRLYAVHHTGTDAGYRGLQCSPEVGSEKSAVPLDVEVPDGWAVGHTADGTKELFSPDCPMCAQLSLYRDHVQAITSRGFARLKIVWRAELDPVSGWAVDPVTRERLAVE